MCTDLTICYSRANITFFEILLERRAVRGIVLLSLNFILIFIVRTAPLNSIWLILIPIVEVL